MSSSNARPEPPESANGSRHRKPFRCMFLAYSLVTPDGGSRIGRETGREHRKHAPVGASLAEIGTPAGISRKRARRLPRAADIPRQPRGSGSVGAERDPDSVRVLEVDPELALGVRASRIARARKALVASVIALDRGIWEVPGEHASRGHLGFLLFEGLLARDLILAGRVSTELVGKGDVLQPGESGPDSRHIRYEVYWHVLSPVKVAVLDERFSKPLAQWPQVSAALLGRAIRRTHRMSVHQALLQLSPVETRLLMLFWHLAERWGQSARSGMVLPLRLTHEILGQLVGGQRASITTALKRVEESGLAVRRADGSWLLQGSPPDELSRLPWHAPARRRV